LIVIQYRTDDPIALATFSAYRLNASTTLGLAHPPWEVSHWGVVK
jgi:hypothetical protein